MADDRTSDELRRQLERLRKLNRQMDQVKASVEHNREVFSHASDMPPARERAFEREPKSKFHDSKRHARGARRKRSAR